MTITITAEHPMFQAVFQVLLYGIFHSIHSQ